MNKVLIGVILIGMLFSCENEDVIPNDCNCVAIRVDLSAKSSDGPLGLDDIEGVPYSMDCSDEGKRVTIQGRDMRVICQDLK